MASSPFPPLQLHYFLFPRTKFNCTGHEVFTRGRPRRSTLPPRRSTLPPRAARSAGRYFGCMGERSTKTAGTQAGPAARSLPAGRVRRRARRHFGCAGTLGGYIAHGKLFSTLPSTHFHSYKFNAISTRHSTHRGSNIFDCWPAVAGQSARGRSLDEVRRENPGRQ